MAGEDVGQSPGAGGRSAVAGQSPGAMECGLQKS